MSRTLAQLLMLLICNQRTVYIDRNLPAKCLIQTVILRCRGKVLVSANHMGNTHQMIIHNVCKVVGRISVRLDQYHIIELCVRHLDLAIDFINKLSRSLIRDILANDKRYSRCQLCLNLFFGQMQAVLVVHHDLFSCHLLAQGIQTLFIAKAVICLSFFDQLLCIFHIDAGLLTLALYIRTTAAVLIRSLIMDQAGLL